MPIPQELNCRPCALLRLCVADSLVDHSRLICKLDAASRANRLLRHEPTIHSAVARISKPVSGSHVGGDGELDEPFGGKDPGHFLKSVLPGTG